MGLRRFGRELIMQGLYQLEMTGIPEEDILDFLIKKIRKEPCVDIQDIVGFVKENFAGIAANKEAIDKLIKEKSKNWHFDRINKVDKSILRLAIYELYYREDIPESVSINEAIEIAKKYSTGDSSKFINGILGAIVRDKKKTAGGKEG
ncbi:MAG: transcription antitermination factor NusB [Armatimonadota bacterium]